MTANFHRSTVPDGPTSVLLAEDDPEMRRMLSARLRRWGLSVIEAEDGTHLAALIDSLVVRRSATAPFTIDLVISDVRMPGASGLEILSLLRAHDPMIPVILMTAFGGADLHAEAERLGADAVFDKPFDIDDLCTAVVNLVSP